MQSITSVGTLDPGPATVRPFSMPVGGNEARQALRELLDGRLREVTL